MQLEIMNIVMVSIITLMLGMTLLITTIRTKRLYNFQVCGFAYLFGGLAVFILGALSIIPTFTYPLYTGIVGIVPFAVEHHSKRFSAWFESPFFKSKK